MITRISAQKRRLVSAPASDTYLLFSWGDYFDPSNVRWGGLRFFNDALLRPGCNLPAHAHDEIEIVTLILSGELRQRQEAQPPIRLRSGDVQVLSSGTGIRHAEVNDCDTAVHFYQIGIFPRTPGLVPMHTEAAFGALPVPNELIAVASGRDREGAVPINADATIYTGSLETYHMVDYVLDLGRSAFLYLTRGALTINGVDYQPGDQARIVDEPRFMIGAIDRSEYVLVDVPTRGAALRERS